MAQFDKRREYENRILGWVTWVAFFVQLQVFILSMTSMCAHFASSSPFNGHVIIVGPIVLVGVNWLFGWFCVEDTYSSWSGRQTYNWSLFAMVQTFWALVIWCIYPAIWSVVTLGVFDFICVILAAITIGEDMAEKRLKKSI